MIAFETGIKKEQPKCNQKNNNKMINRIQIQNHR